MKKEPPLIRQPDDGIDRAPPRHNSPVVPGIFVDNDGRHRHPMTTPNGTGADPHEYCSSPAHRRPFRHVLVASLLLGVLVLTAIVCNVGGGSAGLLRRRGLIRSAEVGAVSLPSSSSTCDASCCSALLSDSSDDVLQQLLESGRRRGPTCRPERRPISTSPRREGWTLRNCSPRRDSS